MPRFLVRGLRNSTLKLRKIFFDKGDDVYGPHVRYAIYQPNKAHADIKYDIVIISNIRVNILSNC
jgi:hypothetical protein